MILAMFGLIIAVGLLSVWVNDSLETLLKQPRKQGVEKRVFDARVQTVTHRSTYRVNHYQIPHQPLPPVHLSDASQKIVRIDFSQKPSLDDNQLGEHVRVLPKAA
jgi:hypothetical protein